MPATTASTGEMNVTPMIDILLVLLVIFMVSQPHRMALEVQVPLPAAPNPRSYPQIVVELAAGGGAALNGQVVPIERLPGQLRSALDRRAVKLVYVKAHSERRYQEVIGLVDLVRGSGADLIAFTPP